MADFLNGPRAPSAGSDMSSMFANLNMNSVPGAMGSTPGKSKENSDGKVPFLLNFYVPYLGSCTQNMTSLAS